MTAATFDAAKAPSHAAFLAVAVLAALTAVRLTIAAHLELHFDEAYYWYWSKNLQLSYFDHPPAVAWFIRAGTVLFGDTEFGVRFFGQISVMAATCLLFDAARRAFSLHSALIAVAATQATLLLGAGSIVMTPDAPLLLFATVVLWALVRFTLTPDGSWWLIAGLAGGAALVSKYSAGLFAVAVALWVLFTPQIRRWLSRPWPWLAVTVSVACFLPVLVWNAEHGWASFAKQGGRLWRWDALRPELMLEYIGSQLALITPGLFVLLVLAAWIVARRAWRWGAPLDMLLALWFILPALFFLAVSPMMRIQANWLAAAWPAAFLALASLIERRGELPKLRLALFWSLITGAAMVALVWLYAVAPFGPDFKGDPLARLNGQRDFAAEVADFAHRNGGRQIIAADYATASMLRFYAPEDMTVAHIAEKPRYAGFVLKPISLPAVVAMRGSSPIPERIAQRYRIGSPATPLWRNYRGQPNSQYVLFVATKALP